MPAFYSAFSPTLVVPTVSDPSPSGDGSEATPLLLTAYRAATPSVVVGCAPATYPVLDPCGAIADPPLEGEIILCEEWEIQPTTCPTCC